MSRHAPLESSLPAPSLYFPVTVHGTVLPSRPLLADEPRIAIDCERDHYLDCKREVLQRPGRGARRLEQPTVHTAIAAAERELRRHLARLPDFGADAAQLDLDAMASELQEDVVIMQLPSGYAPERARAVYLHVCFPSGWDPAQMLGKSFPALHARVPREPGFDRADRAPYSASLFAVPAERYVWSLTPDAQLDHHPQTPRPHGWVEASQAFLRVERQVILPLPAAEAAASALFLIRTYLYPLTRLSDDQLAVLADALTQMSAPIRRYKGMLGHEPHILQLLAAARAQ